MNIVELKPAEPVAAESITFQDFWDLYPKRVAKKDALKAWNRIDPKLHCSILTALAAWRPVWAKKDQDFIPHPATWLNGERWEDELPRTDVATHQSQQAFAPTEPAARSIMPDKVRALLASLRK